VVRHGAESSLGPVLRRAFRHGHGAHQAMLRVGQGDRAWRDPRPLVRASAALARLGIDPADLEAAERRRLGLLARLGYAARMAGSAWYELERRRAS
jgi:hypothetical protein